MIPTWLQDTINRVDRYHIIIALKGQSDIDEGNNEFINIFFKHGQSCLKPNSLVTARLPKPIIYAIGSKTSCVGSNTIYYFLILLLLYPLSSYMYFKRKLGISK